MAYVFRRPWSASLAKRRRAIASPTIPVVNVTVNISGAASATSAGIVLPQVSALPTGAASATAAGSVFVGIAVTLSGAASSSAAGQVLPGVTVNISGTQSATAAGQVQVGDEGVFITGVQLAISVQPVVVTAGMDTHDGVSQHDIDRYLAWRKRWEDREAAELAAEVARIEAENAPPPPPLATPMARIHPMKRPMTADESAREEDDALAVLLYLEAA